MASTTIASIYFFLIGFLVGCLISSVMYPWSVRVLMVAVMWLPIAALLLLQYTGVFDPGTLSALSLLLPRAFKYPLLGFLIGYSIQTAFTVSR